MLAPSLYWIALFLLVTAPLVLGANRGAVWLPLAAILFAGLAIHAYRNALIQPAGIRFGRISRLMLVLFGAWACLPLLQLLPVPLGVAKVIAPGPIGALQTADDWVSFTVNAQATLDELVLRVCAVLFFFIALYVAQHRQWRERYVWVIAIGGFANAAFGLFNYFTNGALGFFDPALGDFDTAVTGTFINKNHFAGYLELTLPFVLVLFCRQGVLSLGSRDTHVLNEKFIFMLVIIAVILAAILLSGSRGAMLALMLSTVLVILLRGFSLSRGVVVAMLLVACIVGGVIALTFDQFVWLYLGHKLTLTRAEIWLSSLELILSSPFFGWGAGSFEDAFGTIKTASFGPWLYDHAHNDYVEYLVTDGMIGGGMLFVAFGLFVFRVLPSLRRATGDNRCLSLVAIAPIALMLHAMVDFNLQIPANLWLFFFVMGLLTGILGLQGQEIERSE